MPAWGDKDNADQLLQLLADLIEAHGGKWLLQGPLVEPTAAFFPDQWEPNMVGLGRLLHRLQHLMGLGGWALELEDARAPLDDDAPPTQQPVVDFIAAEDGRLAFQVDQLGPAEAVLGALCFEVARAFIAVHQAQHPFRASPATDDSASREAQERAAVATVYLGLGLITADAAHSFHQQGELIGNYAVTYRAHMVMGALPAGDLTFLLAVQLVLRGVSGAEAAPLLGRLGSNQARDVRQWLELLQGQADQLRQRLGLPDEEPGEALEPPDVPPLDAGLLQDLRDADQRYENPLQGEQTHRYWQAKTVTCLFIGLFIGMVPALILLLTNNGLLVAAIPMVIGGVAGAALGSRRRIYYCGACQMVLRDHEQRCPRCAASMVGDRPWSRLKTWEEQDEEEGDDELTRQALEAGVGEQDDDEPAAPG